MIDYLFLIIPHVIIIPRFKTNIATYNSYYLTGKRHFFDCLFSVLSVVLVAFVKTLSHKTDLTVMSRAE